MLIKIKDYKVGINHIRLLLADNSKDRAVAFESGEAVEVDEEELNIIPKHWYEEVEDGG